MKDDKNTRKAIRNLLIGWACVNILLTALILIGAI